MLHATVEPGQDEQLVLSRAAEAADAIRQLHFDFQDLCTLAEDDTAPVLSEELRHELDIVEAYARDIAVRAASIPHSSE